MRPKTTARQRREARRIECARELQNSRTRHDLTQDECSREYGMDDHIFQRMEDKNKRDTITAADLAESTGEVADINIDVLRWIVRQHHYTLTPLPSGKHPTDDVAMLAAAIKEHADAIALAATGVGIASSAQLVELVREGTEAIEAMSAIVERARKRLDEIRNLTRSFEARGDAE